MGPEMLSLVPETTQLIHGRPGPDFESPTQCLIFSSGFLRLLFVNMFFGVHMFCENIFNCSYFYSPLNTKRHSEEFIMRRHF